VYSRCLSASKLDPERINVGVEAGVFFRWLAYRSSCTEWNHTRAGEQRGRDGIPCRAAREKRVWEFCAWKSARWRLTGGEDDENALAPVLSYVTSCGQSPVFAAYRRVFSRRQGVILGALAFLPQDGLWHGAIGSGGMQA
jgi:hypothetical protein